MSAYTIFAQRPPRYLHVRLEMYSPSVQYFPAQFLILWRCLLSQPYCHLFNKWILQCWWETELILDVSLEMLLYKIHQTISENYRRFSFSLVVSHSVTASQWLVDTKFIQNNLIGEMFQNNKCYDNDKIYGTWYLNVVF